VNIISYHDGHTATAALICDGKLEACVSEERFSRNKCQMGYPKKSIEYCLSVLGERSLNKVLVSGKRPPDPVQIRASHSTTANMGDLIDLQYNYFRPIFIEGESQKDVYYAYYKNMFESKEFPDSNYLGMESAKWSYEPQKDTQLFREIQIKTIVDHLRTDNIEKKNIHFVEHHPGHAAYAYYASNFRKKECLVFTLDGSGEGVNATISVVKNDVLSEVYRTTECNIGRLWKYITLLLAMTPDQHEFKVMGLAPYAHKYHAEKVLKIFEDNFLSNDGIGFKYNKRPKDIYFSFKKLLEGHRFDSIAAGLQLYTEKIVYQWMRNAMLKYSINRVVFSGGVSMNIKLNKHIASMPEIEDFYVSPSGGDESLAIGSYYKYTKEKEIKPLSSIYLGPKYSSVEVIHAIQSYNNKYRVDESVTYSDVASLIAEGNIVARFDGRMEFGARALGNRSILGDPSKIETMKRIN